MIEEVAAQSLPAGYGYEYGGMAREEASSGGAQTVFHLRHLYLPYLSDSGLSLREFPHTVCRYLLRAVRADGVVPFRQNTGLENNIYLQTGVIMLIGLLAKTAILITEYAIERRRKGMGIVESPILPHKSACVLS